jgi:hypothetical protein
MEKYEFLNRWNIQKREYKEMKRVALTINLAPTQKSTKAYIIGIAVGSTENQDFEILNEKLEKDTGIKGVEVSYQNVNQRGISPDFWKIANSKASQASRDKYSRDHLKTKYLWAPSALAVYVPQKEAVSLARKIMIKKYGKTVNGEDPIWPDGSSMRFLPIKGVAIKNAQTKEIVRKRMAFHIWLKANEITLDTNMKDIYKSIKAFGHKTFAEIVLGLEHINGNRVFTHFNRAWSSDPRKQQWSLSVRSHLLTSARDILDNMQVMLCDKYGDEVNQFFAAIHIHDGWADGANRNMMGQDDEDDWFDDEDDIEEMVRKGIVDSSFLQFLSEKVEEDRQSVASWGTGETTYTEIVTAAPEISNTTTSSITSSGTPNLSMEEQEKRKGIVRVRLLMAGVTETELKTFLIKKIHIS